MNKIAVLFVGNLFLIDSKFQEITAEDRKNTPHLETFDAGEVSVEEILSRARNLPFLASRQVFRIMHAEELKKDACAALSQYLVNPAPFTFLFLQSDNIEKSSPLVKIMLEKGSVLFLGDDENKTASGKLIQEKLKSSQKNMSPEAMQKLKESMEDVPELLGSVLDQLVLYADDQKTIDAQMVDHFREDFKEIEVFSLTNSLSDGDPGRALTILRQLIEKSGDDDVIGFLGLLNWHLRRFWQARVLLDEGQPESTAMKKCGVSPKQAPFFLRRLRTFERKKLEAAIEKLFWLDWKLKTGRVEGTTALESWIVQTMI